MRVAYQCESIAFALDRDVVVSPFQFHAHSLSWFLRLVGR